MGQIASATHAGQGRRHSRWLLVPVAVVGLCCTISQPAAFQASQNPCSMEQHRASASRPSRCVRLRAKPTPFNKDEFWTKKAREENLPARSYYKLEEIDRKVNLFQTGMSVLDLGCAPGSWSIYASRQIGTRGKVLGLDLLPVKTVLPKNVDTMVADVTKLDGIDIPVVDVLMSDMAPSTIGVSKFDHANSAVLVREAMKIANVKLRRGGSFVAKILDGAEGKAVVREMEQFYERVRKVRVKATRTQSNEMYIIGLEKKLAPEVSFQNTHTAGMGTNSGGEREKVDGRIPSFMQYELPPKHQRRQRARNPKATGGSKKQISHNFEGW